MNLKDAIEYVIQRCKAEGRSQDIPSALNKVKAAFSKKPSQIDSDLAWLDGADRESYIHDMKIAQRWASVNRQAIVDAIAEKMGWDVSDRFETVHNYLGEDNIIRKSAISAKSGEKVLIPLNMRDGSIIAVGRGNEDWNCSAPHGAGRLLSRAKAKASISLDSFEKSMEGVWTSSVNASTVDEAPAAYKPSNVILSEISDTVDVIEVVKPAYNFKASE